MLVYDAEIRFTNEQQPEKFDLPPQPRSHVRLRNAEMGYSTAPLTRPIAEVENEERTNLLHPALLVGAVTEVDRDRRREGIGGRRGMSCSWRFLFNLPLWHRGSPDRLCSLSAPVVADQQLFRSFPARRGGFGGHYYCGLVRSSCFFGFRCYSVSDSNGIAGGVVRILESGPIARSLDPPVINKHIRTSYIREREGEREICGEQPVSCSGRQRLGGNGRSPPSETMQLWAVVCGENCWPTPTPALTENGAAWVSGRTLLCSFLLLFSFFFSII
jgi:hypothetical protein